jgi:flagellar hook-basal body complex protein FliE
MATIPTVTVSPAAAAGAYARVDRAGAPDAEASFGSALRNALEGAVRDGQAAEDKALQAITGTGSLTEVVTALAQAELTLQTATAVRDRVIQAYQDIIRMPI